MTYAISKSDRQIKGKIYLDGSKSISNRALMIRALCDDFFEIVHLSTSNDTQVMQLLLESPFEALDAGVSGTAYRFMAAYLATRPGSHILMGAERMKQRPIGPLVEALRKLGARIEYLEREGYPPLMIRHSKQLGTVRTLAIPATVSSQFLSALLLIAPVLPDGLELKLEGKPVSKPYVEMTLQMMEYFGVSHTWEENTIRVPAQKYQPRPFRVEADWTAASYYYAMAAFSRQCDLKLFGLHTGSWQGDAIVGEMMQYFGVETVFLEDHVCLSKVPDLKPVFEWDFLPHPDLVQTLAVVCGGLGVRGLFTGLDTLSIKETDRIAALQNELARVGVFLSELPSKTLEGSDLPAYLIEGKAEVKGAPLFRTYGDHRMAMAFAPLAMFGDVKVEDPEVVKKSYPAFWKDIQKIGFAVSE